MSSKHIYIKINTIPATEERESKEFELFYDKYKTAKSLGSYEDAYIQFIEDAHKHYLFGKIYSISVGSVYEEDKIAVKVLKGTEENILKHFYNLYTENFFKEAKSVVWRSEFILPFLSMRSLKNKVRPTANDLNPMGKRVWNLQCLDLYEYVTGAGYYVPSLEEVAFMLNLQTDFINNADTRVLLKSGQENMIDESSINEVKALINIHRILQGSEPIEAVNSNVIEVGEVTEVKEIPLLEKLYKENIFSAEIKNKLEQTLKKKRITARDKEGIFTIIRGVWIHADFENQDQDSKKVIEQKEKEIREWLNSL